MKLGYRYRLYRVSEQAEVLLAEMELCRLPTLRSHSYYAGTVGHVSEQTVRQYMARQNGR